MEYTLLSTSNNQGFWSLLTCTHLLSLYTIKGFIWFYHLFEATLEEKTAPKIKSAFSTIQSDWWTNTPETWNEPISSSFSSSEIANSHENSFNGWTDISNPPNLRVPSRELTDHPFSEGMFEDDFPFPQGVTYYPLVKITQLAGKSPRFK